MLNEVQIMNILIVEDNKYQLENLKKMVIEGLGNHAGNIYIASDIANAQRIYEEDHIDFFMLDISLGYESGLKLADMIHSTPSYEDACIAVISAHKKYENQATGVSKCHVFIEKPYRKEEIIELVNRALIHHLEKI